ncbi:MAG: hypothetical protein ACXAEN_14765 [Candidatus Thorarchaeota archaeon]|jgi:hypothetical protein
MQLAFYRGSSDGVFGKAIKWWTKSEFSHVEILFEGGVSWSSSLKDGGVRFKKIKADEGKWVYVDMPFIEPTAEFAIKAWAASKIGASYGMWDCAKFVLPFLRSKSSQWFCSEAVLTALQSQWFLLNHRPDKISPGKLYDIVRGAHSQGGS